MKHHNWRTIGKVITCVGTALVMLTGCYVLNSQIEKMPFLERILLNDGHWKMSCADHFNTFKEGDVITLAKDSAVKDQVIIAVQGTQITGLRFFPGDPATNERREQVSKKILESSCKQYFQSEQFNTVTRPAYMSTNSTGNNSTVQSKTADEAVTASKGLGCADSVNVVLDRLEGMYQVTGGAQRCVVVYLVTPKLKDTSQDSVYVDISEGGSGDVAGGAAIGSPEPQFRIDRNSAE
jgi:hypothetical protein